jgi:tetratricopeptide (TPR) repeat protein
MRVARLRIIAWGIGLAVVAILAAGGRNSRTNEALAVRPVGGELPRGEKTPRLFHLEGPVDPLPVVSNRIPPPARPSVVADIDDEPLRELPPAQASSASPPNVRMANVIREPRREATVIREPERKSPAYALDANEVAPMKSPPPVPVELLLAAPERAEAPVEPRVSREVPSQPQPKFESLPPAPLPIISTDNPAMQPVHDVARKHVQRGFSLGERNALYAARTEFIQALRTVAQAVDAQAGLPPKDPQACSQALARGLEALTEADDFAPPGSRLDGDLDLRAIIEAHRTPACKSAAPASQLAALQAYFDYAGQQLTRAAAGSPVASQALTGLGKTYTTGKEAEADRLSGAKAMVFHQAAVAADSRNHLASNELGVLLAKYGQWQAAKQAFTQSLRVQSDAAAWQNLAAVHGKLGEQELARLALQERDLLTHGKLPNRYSGLDGSPTVRWVDPKAFSGPPEEAQVAAKPGIPQASAKRPSKTSQSPASTAQKSDAWSWLPWR